MHACVSVGARPWVRERRCTSVFPAAVKYGHADVASYLKEQGAKRMGLLMRFASWVGFYHF